jgi:predicted transcriptional regulator
VPGGANLNDHAAARGLAWIEYILQYMKQLLIELEDDDAARLEKVAPSRTRRRSEFIRGAIRRALWEIEEQATADAYRRLPDSATDAYVDVRVWDSNTKTRGRGAR